MGSSLSCCGSKEDSNFQGEGRTLNSSRPAQEQQHTIPARAGVIGQEQSSQANKATFAGGGRTLSGGNTTSAGARVEQPQPRAEGPDAAKAREDRARAVEVVTSEATKSYAFADTPQGRMNKRQPTGKIGQQLSEQKRKTDAAHLADHSERVVGARQQDAGQEIRAYN